VRGAALASLIAAAGAVLAPAVAAQERVDRLVTIQARSAPDGPPLSHAVIAVPALGIERFSGERGAVIVAARPGPMRVTVKRLGYEPKDTVLQVTEAPTQVVSIALTRLLLVLDEVRVAAWPACTEPGAPSPDTAPGAGAARVLEQLRQNAERFDLLRRTYPFIYSAERMFTYRLGEAPEVTQLVDTMLLSGDPPWAYRPGTLLASSRAGLILNRRTYTMRLPTLSDFASRAFVETHCFHLAGVEEKAGQRLLRMDIVASERLRSSDVNVTVWLDTADFRLRFAAMELTRIPSQIRGLTRMTSEVTYLELIPFVPVMFFTVGENLERGSAGEERRLLERQQVLDVRYLGPRPDSAGVDAAATRPPPQ
jgi:hypothetical protein